MDFLQEAKNMQERLVWYRRQLHAMPEVGRDLPNTVAFVRAQLEEMGYHPRELGGGLMATVMGKATGKCILLRADMDALPVAEASGLSFAAKNGNMHGCGHDMHTAMLLGAAALLKRQEASLGGTVKLVFQPDEEGFTGAKEMLQAGVLENPKVQAAMAMHVHSGTPTGAVLLGKGCAMAGCSVFSVTVTGKGCHGAMPETGVDPIAIATQVYLGLQELVTREIPVHCPAVVTIGCFHAGQSANVIPGQAELRGTIRCYDKELTTRLLQRIGEIAQGIAHAFRGRAETKLLAAAPPLENDPVLSGQALGYARQLFGDKAVVELDRSGMGSEDFAAFSQRVPSVYFLLGAGSAEENPDFGKPMHNEKVIFNEDVLYRGAALYAKCAAAWLEA